MLYSRRQEVIREGVRNVKKALQQCPRKFVDGIINFISAEKEYYKLIIIACKEKTNMIKELVFNMFFPTLCAYSLDKERMIYFIKKGKNDLIHFICDCYYFHSIITFNRSTSIQWWHLGHRLLTSCTCRMFWNLVLYCHWNFIFCSVLCQFIIIEALIRLWRLEKTIQQFLSCVALPVPEKSNIHTMILHFFTGFHILL